MSDIDEKTEVHVGAWLSLPEVAESLGIAVTQVRQLLRDRNLLAVRRGERRTLQVPALFVQDGKPVKGLAGTLTLLADSGYDEAEALRWLFTPDDSLPGTPAQALAENRGTEVRRRAQALGF
ncbi:MAG: Rv2175c family DNA-binding protein [Actinomycetes bacterium]